MTPQEPTVLYDEARARVLAAVKYIYENDCDFLTAETVGMYAHVTTEQARTVMLNEGHDPRLVG